jgi:hypothetical protein
LVLRGEAGIGKTALLDYLTDSASDLTVPRAVGVESEMELAYASVHQLCTSLLDGLERLPAPQRDVLRVVFGLSVGPPPDRFLVQLSRSARASSSARARSSTTCTKYSPSSGWPAAGTLAACSPTTEPGNPTRVRTGVSMTRTSANALRLPPTNREELEDRTARDPLTA